MNVKVGVGSLRSVEPKSERAPGYKGSITIGDQKFWLSGWKRQSADGPWLSLSVEKTDDDAPAAKPKTYAQRREPS
jgi:hypothetical protein